MSNTEEILTNVIWLVEAFDEKALGEVGDLPLLEMAKWVAVAPLPTGFAFAAQALERRTPPRYPTDRKTLTKQAHYSALMLNKEVT